MSEHARQLRIAIDNLRNTATTRGHDMFVHTAKEALDALLAEHRAEVEALKDRLRDSENLVRAARGGQDALKQQLLTTRDAVLEEGIGAIDESFEKDLDVSAQDVLRALKSQPARRYVDMEKVREVRDAAHRAYQTMEVGTHGWSIVGDLLNMMGRLGVDLDAEGEACIGCGTQGTDLCAACEDEARMSQNTMAAEDVRQTCTCLGTCKGAAGLGSGWRCALEKKS